MNDSYLKPLKRKKWVDTVVEEILHLIKMDIFQDDRLPPERILMEKLNVGRSTLREALRSLEVLGVVETLRGEGTFIIKDKRKIYSKPIELGLFSDNKSVEDLLDARSIFEEAIIDLAIAKIEPKELEELEKAVIEMEACQFGGLQSFLRADYNFHMTLANSTKNEFVGEVIVLINRVIQKEKENSLRSQSEYKKSAKLHRDIFESMKSRNIEEARRNMQKHMRWMKKILERG